VSTDTLTATRIGFPAPSVSGRLFETGVMGLLRRGRIGFGLGFLASHNPVVAGGEGEIAHRSGECLEQVV
jgi:hypothetical protein